MKIFIFKIIFLLSTIQLLSQSIPYGFYINDLISISNDFGEKWKLNSSFKPYQWKDMASDSSHFSFKWLNEIYYNKNYSNIFTSHIRSDGLIANVRFGASYLNYFDKVNSHGNNDMTIYGYFHYRYGKNFFIWLYPRITTNSESIYNFSGEERDRNRLGFSSGETDVGGMGFSNEWFQFWFERGRQNWGALNLNNAVLSENSPSYDSFVLQLNFNYLNYKSFNGFLETIESNYNRYISGKGIEYNNRKNLILGFHEVAIYSGPYRPLDLAYLNPMSTHLEIELNQRDNDFGGTGSGNAVWQFVYDWMPRKGIRLRGNLIFDEIALDDSITVNGTRYKDVSNYGSQTRISLAKHNKNISSIYFFEHTFISSYALRHEKGQNNFVSRNKILGSDVGSDSDQLLLGMKFILKKNSIGHIIIGRKRSGENNIMNNMYVPYGIPDNSSFPSGITSEENFMNFKLKVFLNDKINIQIDHKKIISGNVLNNDYFNVSFNIIVSKKYIIN